MSDTERLEGIEFCGCTTYGTGEECGMVVCWECEQIVGKVTNDGEVTTKWMQAEIRRLRNALEQISYHEEQVDPIAESMRQIARQTVASGQDVA